MPCLYSPRVNGMPIPSLTAFDVFLGLEINLANQADTYMRHEYQAAVRLAGKSRYRVVDRRAALTFSGCDIDRGYLNSK